MNNVQKLNRLHELTGEEQLSDLLSITPKTLRSWLKEEVIPKESTVSARLDQILNSISSPEVDGDASFTFIDLFAGIGGIRQGFESIGGQCVFTSEWDKYSQKTYRANYKDHHPVVGDITKIDTDMVPDHDVE